MNFLEKLNPQTLVQAFNPTSTASKVLGVASAVFSHFSRKDEPAVQSTTDDFSLTRFTEELRTDGFRLAKGYYYNVLFTFLDKGETVTEVERMLTFQCQKVTLPGWQVKTEQMKVYGVPYDVAIGLQQDPIWLTFNVDIRHRVEDFFMTNRKLMIVDDVSYSPHYKDDYQFYLMIQVTDENFIPIRVYTFGGCMIRTVQNISYGADETEWTKVNAEVVYETVRMVDYQTERTKYQANPEARNPNQLSFGPFTADISLVNQAINTMGKIPDWFKSPTKI